MITEFGGVWSDPGSRPPLATGWSPSRRSPQPRHHPPDVRQRAIELVRLRGRPVAQIATNSKGFAKLDEAGRRRRRPSGGPERPERSAIRTPGGPDRFPMSREITCVELRDATRVTVQAVVALEASCHWPDLVASERLPRQRPTVDGRTKGRGAAWPNFDGSGHLGLDHGFSCCRGGRGAPFRRSVRRRCSSRRERHLGSA